MGTKQNLDLSICTNMATKYSIATVPPIIKFFYKLIVLFFKFMLAWVTGHVL